MIIDEKNQTISRNAHKQRAFRLAQKTLTKTRRVTYSDLSVLSSLLLAARAAALGGLLLALLGRLALGAAALSGLLLGGAALRAAALGGLLGSTTTSLGCHI